MRIYEKRNEKNTFQCSYCLGSGHNKRHCPTMKSHWDANCHLHSHELISMSDNVLGVDKSMFPQAWTRFYGDSEALRQFRTHWRYMKSRFVPEQSTETKKKRKASSCGFCGDTTHTRRNCEIMKNFVYILNEANKEYRSQFYDRYIEGMGLGPGALVKLRSGSVGIITEFDTESAMFTNLISRWNDYHTSINLGIMVGERTHQYSFACGAIYDSNYTENFRSYGIWAGLYGSFGVLAEVLSPAPHVPDKEWFMHQAPCFDWIVKKRRVGPLLYSFRNYIKEFYPHEDLREKLGDELYDSNYFR